MANHDFNRAILKEVAHRRWPMPDRHWVMTQTWHDLLFAHWPVDARVLRGKVPSVSLDLFDGAAWLAIVPFRMTNVAPRGVPSIRSISEFPELNIRASVRVNEKPGIYFSALTQAARWRFGRPRNALLNLPYYWQR